MESQTWQRSGRSSGTSSQFSDAGGQLLLSVLHLLQLVTLTLVVGLTRRQARRQCSYRLRLTGQRRLRDTTRRHLQHTATTPVDSISSHFTQ